MSADRCITNYDYYSTRPPNKNQFNNFSKSTRVSKSNWIEKQEEAWWERTTRTIQN